jgi:molybdate transport system substrate-binding protein
MSDAIRGISSMATRQVLAELAAAYELLAGCPVQIESVGGVDAARRVQAGEPFDVVILASDAIDKLIASDAVVAGSKVDLVRSPVAVAVRAGAARPDIATEDALRQAVQAAACIGYSTGPSGVSLTRLFERWGIAGEIQQRLVQAPPGVPVGTLVAKGEVALGFQQLSELLHLEGITIVGPLPDAVQIITTFSGALCAGSSRAGDVRRMLAFMASPEVAAAKRRHGMEPASIHSPRRQAE